MRIKRVDPLHANEVLTIEQQAAIGCVAVESSRLEHLIMVMIWSILSLEESMGRIITDNIPTISGKLDLLHRVINDKNSTINKEEFNLIYQIIKKIIPRRNTVIHGQWQRMYTLSQVMNMPTITDGPTGHAQVNSRSRKSNNVKSEKAEDIMSIALGIHHCYSSLYDFSQRYSLLPPLPERVR